jgi:hypothetical protein
MLVISTLSSDSATAFLLPPGVQRVAKTFSMRQQPGLNPLAGNQHCGSRYSDPHPKIYDQAQDTPRHMKNPAAKLNLQ